MTLTHPSADVPAIPASQRPRVAVVGAGYWGKNIVRNFAALNALAAVVDRDHSSAKSLCDQHGATVASFEDVLLNESIAAIAVATPAVSHHGLAKAALEAGKHVFVEKPLALTLSEAEELVTIAERLDRRLMVGHLLQYHPAFNKLKDLVREGRLGRLRYLYSNRLNFGKIRREEDILWSFAPHDLSMILSLVGQEPDRVETVGSYYLHQRIADVTTTHLSFHGGERAHVFVSWLHPFKEQKLVVVGDEAMAVFDDGEPWERKLLMFPHRINWRDGLPSPQKAESVTVPVEQGEALQAECQHFLHCIAIGATPRTDGQEGLRVLRVLTRASEHLHRAQTHARDPTGRSRAIAARFPHARIHETVYVDDNVEIGDDTSIWHFSHILASVKIGKHCVLGQNVVIGPNVTIGKHCKIQNNVSVYQGVTLEDGVFCGPSCVFTNVNNPRAEIERKSEFRPTLVKRGATIGANATVVCGHVLGEYCFIAAGSVVTSDVPAYGLMAGVPARRIGWMSRHGERLGPGLVCPATGRRYREIGPDQLKEIEEDEQADHV
jgi:UDP-2-acetamido-3-amino-2,3-dideoxy-glucuronate N-acetyltransferase